MFVVCFVMHDKREQQSVTVEVPMASSIEDEVEKHPHHEFSSKFSYSSCQLLSFQDIVDKACLRHFPFVAIAFDINPKKLVDISFNGHFPIILISIPK